MEKKVNAEEMKLFAADFARGLGPQEDGATIIGLSGELGSGKTTFVQEVARSFGVEEYVTSPTFVLLKRYTLHDARFTFLIHIDAYRLESGEELRALGWDDISKDPQNVIFIEWIERVRDVVGSVTSTLSFEYVDDTTRLIQQNNNG